MNDLPLFKNPKTAKVVFFLSLWVALFWCSVMLVDVYRFALVGAIYEILWLPMLLLIFILPIISLVFWVITKFSLKSPYFYAMLIIALTAVVITVKT